MTMKRVMFVAGLVGLVGLLSSVIIVLLALTAMPPNGFVYELDLTAENANAIIANEIFEPMPDDVSILEATLLRGKDTSLYVKCVVPESSMASIETNPFWRVKFKAGGDMQLQYWIETNRNERTSSSFLLNKDFNGNPSIKWLVWDPNQVDYTCTGGNGVAKMLVMRPDAGNRVLFITGGKSYKLSSSFWEYANNHNKRVRQWGLW